jgi:hypothetical protein
VATISVVLLAMLFSVPSATAALGRVVAIGDSLAAGMKLGPKLPGSIVACGLTTGGYPELTRARLGLPAPANNLTTTGQWANATCNGGFSDLFANGWYGIPEVPGHPELQENDGTYIPPQYNTLSGSEQAVILGTGGNEAYFGEVAFACLGYEPDLAIYNANQQGQNLPYTNNCATQYGADGSGLRAKVAISKTKVGQALDGIHTRAPGAKVFLVGVPRVVPPNGIDPATGRTCMPNPILTPVDTPIYAIWEDELRSAMMQLVAARSSWVSYVDMQAISGSSHTMCAANWSQRWMNPWNTENIQYPGIALHNNPAGASAVAWSVIDSLHAAGLDTGSQATNPTNPVVQISTPVANLVTRNASTNVVFSATDNVAVKSCTPASGSSAALSPGANTITVDCEDFAGNHGGAQVSVTRDNTAPTITGLLPSDGTNTTAASVLLTYSASDNVGTPSCSPASGSTVPLSTGANTITVSCTDSVGNPASASVVVNRGSVPSVAIASPANGQSTTVASINVAFTVGGGSSIPAGTSCHVNGTPTVSAGTNTVTLAQGSNQITVLCSNQFGAGTPASVTVTGSPPSAVSIAAPADGTNTTASSINVAYLVNGASSIPLGTSCTVGGLPSDTPASNPVALTPGANTITVLCTGAFGAKSASVVVNRGTPPVVAITAPANGSSTAAGSVNVAYSVGGASSIPAGTACSVNGVASVSATTNNVALTIGANAISVRCTNQFGEGAPAGVSVTRGVPPVVAISAPASGLNTTQSSVNVSYSVDGAGSIPGGTSCSVGGSASSSASANPVALVSGSNQLAVSCTNSFGTSAPVSVTVNRGSVPVVAITAPGDGTNTAAPSINVAYTVNGQATIPGGTSCSVKGAASSSATSNPVPLDNGSNAIAVSCTNAFGASLAATVSVNRGAVPVVAITAPAAGTNTTASSINLSYTVGGASSIPGGTSCVAGGATSASATNNPLALSLGENSLSVSCTNAFGSSLPQTVTVNRGVPPVVELIAPGDATATSASSTNVVFTVNGASSIPGGTSCKVGATSTSSTTSNSVALTLGENTITVTCTSVFGSTSTSVTVTRGNGPSVAVTAPANGLKTTLAGVNVAFTVNGGSSIPAGTSCSVDGKATVSTTTNPFALELGPGNTISVTCVNSLGSDTRSVTVERGTAPALTVEQPADGMNTTEISAGVVFSVSGSGSPACSVNGSAASSPANVELALGANQIAVSCSSAFGTSSRVLTVNRGVRPIVYINAAPQTETIADEVNATYVIDGGSEIPAGTTCSVNGQPSSNPLDNPVALTVGENTVWVTCTNQFGSSTARVFVTFTPRPEDPAAPGEAEPSPPPGPGSLALKLQGAKQIKPARSGGILLKSRSSKGLRLLITLDKAALVELKIEKFTGAKKTKVVARAVPALLAGTSKLRLTGRGEHRPLAAGRYRVVVSVPGTTLVATSAAFRVKR